ncbi:hypothetical protein GBF38_022570, partial [Nibea albiflora]
MTYTQPLSRAADVGPFQLNTCWLGAAAECVLKYSGQQVKRVSCRLQADCGAADLRNKIR